MDVEYKYYGEKTIEHLDAEVEFLELEYEKECRNRLLAILVCLIFIFRGPILFNIKYAFPKVTAHTTEKINTYIDPIQKNIITPLTNHMKYYDGEEDVLGNPIDSSKEDIAYIKEKNPLEIFKIKTADAESEVQIIPMAEYSISGKMVASNHFFWYRSTFDRVVLLDIGLAWGNLSPKNLLQHYFKFTSKKVLYNGGRALSTKILDKKLPYSINYIKSHESHTHVIPANGNILSALLKVKKYESVKMDGLLVDVVTHTKHYKGSLSRDDYAKGRGDGSCELMYVTKVQIGNRIYE